MKNHVIVLGSLGLLGLVMTSGCSGNKVDQALDTAESVTEKGCECEAATMMTKAMCIARAEANLPTESERQCLRDVYDRHSAELDGTFNCEIDAANDFGNCIDDATCNAAALQTCLTAYTTATEVCPEAAESIRAELDACTP